MPWFGIVIEAALLDEFAQMRAELGRLVLRHEGEALGDFYEPAVGERVGQPSPGRDGHEAVVSSPHNQHRPVEGAQRVCRGGQVALAAAAVTGVLAVVPSDL